MHSFPKLFCIAEIDSISTANEVCVLHGYKVSLLQVYTCLDLVLDWRRHRIGNLIRSFQHKYTAFSCCRKSCNNCNEKYSKYYWKFAERRGLKVHNSVDVSNPFKMMVDWGRLALKKRLTSNRNSQYHLLVPNGYIHIRRRLALLILVLLMSKCIVGKCITFPRRCNQRM